MMNPLQAHFRSWQLAAIALVLAVPVQAQPVMPVQPATVPAVKAPVAQPALPAPVDLQQRYPTGSITSVETADSALQDVKQERTAIEARFKHEERRCYQEVFLANRCRDQALQQRRFALAKVRTVQIEADQFKRHDAVVKRDQAMAEKQAKQPEDAKSRAASAQEHAARMAEKQKEARQKRQAAEAKRAANEAAYAEKLRNAEARQREVAENKAKKEAQRRKNATAVNQTQPPAEPGATGR